MVVHVWFLSALRASASHLLSCLACSAVLGKVSDGVMRLAALIFLACRLVGVSWLSLRPLELVGGVGAGGKLPVPVRITLWVLPSRVGECLAWALGVGGCGRTNPGSLCSGMLTLGAHVGGGLCLSSSISPDSIEASAASIESMLGGGGRCGGGSTGGVGPLELATEAWSSLLSSVTGVWLVALDAGSTPSDPLVTVE